MEMSESIAKLAEALATAQAAIEGAVKDRNNPAFKSKYADLSACWEAWQAVGPKQGLAIIQLPGAMREGRAEVTTILAHKSGEWMRETLCIPVTKQDAQGFGSALTYARRYALSAFVGIAPEDDDGNAAVGNGRAQKAAQPADDGPWHGGPHPHVTALKAALRTFTEQARNCGDSDTLQALIDEAKPTLAQCRSALPEWWQGKDGNGICKVIADARARLDAAERDGVPRDPGDGELPETVQRLLNGIQDAATMTALKAWNSANEALIAQLEDEHRAMLKAEYIQRGKAIRADLTPAG